MKKSTYTIATLGSHSALQILKGAKDEGFRTLLFVTRDKVSLYKRFRFVDTIEELSSYEQLLEKQKKYVGKKVIMIPHGSFVAYLGVEGNKNLRLDYFGNKKILDWEGDRQLQLTWLRSAGIRVPRVFTQHDHIDRPVIVKSYGAAGGTGYFVAHSQKDFEDKIHTFNKNYIVQEYVIGVPIYLHFFYSPITKQVELLSMDRRYETNVDSLGRMPLAHQENIEITPSFVVVGNSPLVLRESLMPEAFSMAEKLVAASQKLINKQGLYGPFCLETIVTPDQKFYVIEVSCRIVAGTNIYVDGSPYSALLYKEPMSTGRRIAREIKIGIQKKKLQLLLD